ncbi:heavy-metal-associated domain-containing protein [Kocuria coralli]|uniref:Heavy-metal-associated domain-containing protein n=1 Tax=Kocuria coralli TaxID=1461025 RepID=A0A5J5KUH8_9MICC|nr:heavy-metal-associated domain-containing protein [Kocuria coralli]KAA9393048.1 heavy-metal-associated domain-containing protein [Kocuria coralli]
MSTTTTEYQVTGMSCGHCESAVREEVSAIPGVTGIDVSAATGRLTVTAEQPIDDAAVIAAVDEAGYEAARS